MSSTRIALCEFMSQKNMSHDVRPFISINTSLRSNMSGNMIKNDIISIIIQDTVKTDILRLNLRT